MSSSRMQPKLLGFSIPRSRPATADGSGSLMNAVNRAADAAAKAELEYQYPAGKYTDNYLRLNAPRHIDIFSRAKTTEPTAAPGYNEDVAERNMDLARVTLEGTQYHHASPSSKFQEGVAARNAYPSLPGSIQISPSAHQGPFTPTQSSQGQVRDMSSSTSNYPQPPTNFEIRPSSRKGYIQSSITSHSQERSDQPWQSAQQFHELPTSRHGIEKAPSSQGPTNYAPLTGTTPKAADVHTFPTIPPKYPGRRLSEGQINGAAPSEALRSYQLSASEMALARSVELPKPSRQGAADPTDGTNGSRLQEHSMRPPSNLSITSSAPRTINLGNRKIMDLTGNDPDVFSEGHPGANYSSSPVLEHARFDTMHKVHGSTVSATTMEERNAQSSLVKPPTSLQSEVGQSTPPGVTLSQPHQDLVSESPASKIPPTTLHSASTFSPISTIASVPPRASVILEMPKTSNLSNVTENRPDSEEGKSPDSRDDIKHTAIIKRSGPQDIHPNEESSKKAVNEIRDRMPQNSASESGRATERGSLAIKEVSKQATSDRQKLSERGVEFPQTDRNLEELPSVQPYVHMTPESLHSIDIVEPGRSFGVSTRDFASTPTKPALTSVPEETEVNGDGKQGRSAKLVTEGQPTSHDHFNHNLGKAQVQPQSHVYKSTFDEAEFARKQADARAALVRLQQSLNESFLVQPHPAQVQSSKNSYPNHAFSLSDGKPVAPSSIFAQVRPTSTDSKSDADRSIEDVRSQKSYHMLTTATESGEIERDGNRKADYDPIPQAESPDKGKQRAEAELNGPGPTVVEDDPTQALQLHLNGHTYQRLQRESQVPPSPGEISLSSFPIPVSSPRQSTKPSLNSVERQATSLQHAPHNSQSSSSGGRGGRILRRQSSQRSQASSTSAFSIPYHMIPDRSSSIRDRSVMEEADE